MKYKTLTAHQKARADLIIDWASSKEAKKEKSEFVLWGGAGVGKTYLISSVIEVLEKKHKQKISHTTLSGKAASVMRSKGISEAQTAHSLIYKPVVDPETQKTTFELNDDSELTGSSLVNIDEISMINKEIGEDLASFKVPMLGVGDCANQLPPPVGSAYFDGETPDAELTEVQRLAANSAIVKVANTIKEGDWNNLERFKNQDFNILPKFRLTEDIMLRADILLCGTNKNRIFYNTIIKNAKGYGTYPSIGAKIMILSNDRATGVFNGEMATITSVRHMNEKGVIGQLKLLKGDPTVEQHLVEKLIEYYSGDKPVIRHMIAEIQKDGEESKRWIPIALNNFELEYGTQAEKERLEELKKIDFFISKTLKPVKCTFGYAGTVHKSQGSEWEKVIFVDDGFGWNDQDLKRRFKYTGTTRSSQKLLIIQ